MYIVSGVQTASQAFYAVVKEKEDDDDDAGDFLSGFSLLPPLYVDLMQGKNVHHDLSSGYMFSYGSR